MNTIDIDNLTKDFGDIRAVDGVSLSFKKGEIVALLGPNGAGKSTCMNMLAGVISQSFGKIKILGKDIENNLIFAKENIGFLPEGSPLYADMSVRQFLGYMAELKGVCKECLANIVKDCRVENVLEQKIETLSKGYLRRVGFAQSIINDPVILLLDEPTDGLDPNQKEHIRELILKMGKNKTIIISTHLLEEASSIANRIVLINKGKVIADGTHASVLKSLKAKDLMDVFRKMIK